MRLKSRSLIIEKFINTRLILKTASKSGKCGGWLVAVRDNMLVVSLGCDRSFKVGGVVNVKTINDAIEAEFNTCLVSQTGRTLVLASPRMIRCSHGSNTPRYLVPEADVVVHGEETSSLAKCLDVSKSGLGIRTSKSLEVGKSYQIAYEVPGYTFALTVECIFCQPIGDDCHRAGMQILSSDRCDTGRWQRFVEAVSRQKKVDLANTLRLMYLPEPSTALTNNKARSD